MADLFSVTAPLLIRYPDTTVHVMVHCLRHPRGLVYFRPFWNRMPAAEGIVLATGEIRGDGPWKVGAAVVTGSGAVGDGVSGAVTVISTSVRFPTENEISLESSA
jgi:hypothetical protein